MIAIHGYRIESVLYESTVHVLYHAIEESSGRPVILKTMQELAVTPLRCSRLRLEHSITSRIPRASVVGAVSLIEHRNVPVFIKENVSGVPLDQLLVLGGMDIADVLTIAVQLADGLDAVHSAKVMHKDVKPENIIVVPATLHTYLTDFDLASELLIENADVTELGELQGSLPYLSPEQTGRMNRAVDYRTDFYSLGVVLYEMLTGVRPFQATDAMEMVHCHIARQPESIRTRRPIVPLMLAHIVEKLMSKTAEERYQSALGIAEDLRQCARAWKENGSIAEFTLATFDASDRLRIPQKLYGREREIESLLHVFEQAAMGSTHYVAVRGYSGIGKTSLINEVQKPITARRGFYCAGKFDQFQRNLPYSALLQALERALRQILSETDSVVQQWRSTIQQALGDNGRVITDVLPLLTVLIGEQSMVGEQGGMDAQRRINETLLSLIGAIATPEHPLVVFVDDMQWADSATLSFLEYMATIDPLAVMMVLSYRDNEVGTAHPLVHTLDVINRSRTALHTIQLSPLNRTHCLELLRETLLPTSVNLDPLATLLIHKTAGNPFFVNQFLKVLSEQGSIVYDKTTKEWTWDLDDIERRQMTDNVVDLMTQKLRQFSAPELHVLHVAAAIGGEFDLPLLATVCGDVRATAQLLWEPVSEGILYADGLVSLGDIIQTTDVDLDIAQSLRCRFQHDRIQQAAYSMVGEAERATIHVAIGRAMLLRNNVDSVFEIVTQLNAGINQITAPDERLRIARLNHDAARKALASAAFVPAHDYALMASRFLPGDAWNVDPGLTRQIYEALAEADMLCAYFDDLDVVCDLLMEHAEETMHAVRVHEFRKRKFVALLRSPEAIRESLMALELLGVRFPKKPTTLHTIAKLVQVQAKVGRKTPADLIAMPEMSDERIQHVFRLTAEMATAVYTVMPALFPLILLKQMELTLRYGNHRYSASVYMGYAIILTVALGAVDKAYALAQAAMVLPERFNHPSLVSKTISAFAILIQHRKEPLENTLAVFHAGYVFGIEASAFEDACFSAVGVTYHSTFLGKELVTLRRNTEAYRQTMIDLGQRRSVEAAETYTQLFDVLLDPTAPTVFDGVFGTETEFMRRVEDTKDQTTISSLRFHMGFAAYMHEDDSAARVHFATGLASIESLKGTLSEALYAQYATLAALMDPRVAEPTRRRAALRIASKNLKTLRTWSAFCPENYEHRLRLVEAEVARVRGDVERALSLYDQSAQIAARWEFLIEEGLSNELAARTCAAHGMHDRARTYAMKAMECYERWGAAGKIRLLQQRYPELIVRTPSNSSSVATTTSHGGGISLDLASVVKASHALAGEIDINALLPKLMTIVMENAGAERGTLLLEREGQWLIEAESDLNNGSTRRMHSVQPDGLVPMSVVSYVVRTLEAVVLADAASSRQFMTDAYIHERQTKSLLCIPIKRQHKIIGVIYLENNLAAGAFTEERLEVLNLLSVQMGISIENAMLYESLERKVQERTAALEAEKKKSEQLLLNVLPASIVHRLKQGETTIADRSSNVTVLFADIVDFTHLSATVEPEHVVDILNTVFNHFDDLVERHGVEKIKTIGDAYMAVGGIPEPREDHAEVMVRLALDMQASIPLLARAVGMDTIKIRVGVHTGSVIAGVIGRSKFSYDLWGDTVNTAARMESHGMPGRVHVSEDVVRKLNGHSTKFAFEKREQIEIKGKGLMTTYFVS
ncbi:AAA family ATPase [soil metagenome]